MIAVQVLTCFPVRLKKKPVAEECRRSMIFFPVIGLILGALLVGVEYLLAFILPGSLVKLILVGLLVIFTGGLHLDGLADTVDALSARIGKEESLRIMKDSTIGPMGVIAILGCLAIKYVILLEFFAPRLYAILLFFPLVGRMAMVTVSQFFPYARQSGTGKAFIGKGGVQETIIAGIISVLISGLLLRLRGLSVLLVAVLIALIVGRYCVKKFGGLTGDNLGLINELGEIVALVGVTIII